MVLDLHLADILRTVSPRSHHPRTAATPGTVIPFPAERVLRVRRKPPKSHGRLGVLLVVR